MVSEVEREIQTTNKPHLEPWGKREVKSKEKYINTNMEEKEVKFSNSFLGVSMTRCFDIVIKSSHCNTYW